MHIFNQIPKSRPNTPLLDSINCPEDLRGIEKNQLKVVADQLREFLLYTTGQAGGHLGAGLGVIELTIALHYIFNTPRDKLVWDIGHQAYPHKMLTGRREQMINLRTKNGIAAFPNREESIYDHFGVGHSSTSISAALGMSIADQLNGINNKHVAIIGDGALTAGMAFEALNHAGSLHQDLLVILNDNNMSISNNVGALSNYCSKILSGKLYTSMREGSKKIFSHPPALLKLAKLTETNMKAIVSPSSLFEALNFNYIGPIDGHNIDVLIDTIENMHHLSGPQFLHIATTKGKGFTPAEKQPIKYHAISKISPTKNITPSIPKYANIFGKWVCDMAAQDQLLTAITPAMREGSDLIKFSQEYPDRYFDVAIAEQHALTLAAGLATSNTKPVVAIYSTFLQRAYDQLIHDICIQNLDVTFAIDRAGLVGEDGPTHAGSFDLSYLNCIPNIIIMTPSDENELYQMLTTAYQHKGPAAVRYPRGSGNNTPVSAAITDKITIGKALIKQHATGASKKKIALLNFGHLLTTSTEVANKIDATLVDMRFVKPLDKEMIIELANTHDLLVTIEENSILGGAGSAVSLLVHKEMLAVKLLNIGLEDSFIEHQSALQMRQEAGLDTAGIIQQINKALEQNSD
jgi:1-deoxy-D-xylulose-5-phosphate synthase